MKICLQVLTSSTRLQNRSFHINNRTRGTSKCTKMKNARTKRAKTLCLFFTYANLLGSCRRGFQGWLLSGKVQGLSLRGHRLKRTPFAIEANLSLLHEWAALCLDINIRSLLWNCFVINTHLLYSTISGTQTSFGSTLIDLMFPYFDSFQRSKWLFHL